MKTILKYLGYTFGWLFVLGTAVYLIDKNNYNSVAREQQWVVIQATTRDCGIGQIAADCVMTSKTVGGGKNAKKKVVVR